MNNKRQLTMVLLLVIGLPTLVVIHYYFVFGSYLFLSVPFSNEYNKTIPIRMIAKIEAEKIGIPVDDFFGGGEYVRYADIFRKMKEVDSHGLKKHFNPADFSNSNEKLNRVSSDYAEQWRHTKSATIEYVLPGDDFIDFVLSFIEGNKTVWGSYRFREEEGNIYFLHAPHKSILNTIISIWLNDVSDELNQIKPVGYMDYLRSVVWDYNSSAYFPDDNNFTLYFNSYHFGDENDATGQNLRKLFLAFIAAAENRNLEEFSKYITKRQLRLLTKIFDVAYQDDYKRFILGFKDMELISYVDASPLYVIYCKVKNYETLQPLFVIRDGGKYYFTGISRRSRSFDMFRHKQIINSLH